MSKQDQPAAKLELSPVDQAAANELARIANLQREWPADPNFVFDALLQGWSVERAKQEYAKRIKAGAA